MFSINDKNYQLKDNLFSLNSSFISNINQPFFSYENQTNNFNIYNNTINQEDFEAINSILNENNHQKNQNYCHYLQLKIISNPQYSNNILYHFLIPYMLQLINNVYGNLIYQNFIEVLEQNNLYHLVNFIKNNFIEISHSPNGTRVIQKLIEKIYQNKSYKSFIFLYLIEMIKGKVCELSIDENANHIIQKFIIYIPSPLNNFIYYEICQNFLLISITKYGCCVIQKCLNNGINEQREKLVYLILQNTFFLITNQFGNYIYQCLLFLNDDNINMKMINIIFPQIISLSKEKYSSNVIEKLFDIHNEKIVNYLINSICSNEKKIIDLITDKYGNYIIQKILSVCNNREIFIGILRIISKNINEIKSTSFGKKLIGKLISKYPYLNEMI